MNQSAQPQSALAIVPQHMPAQVESASSFAAATAKATVEARYLMALRSPRNWDQVRTDMLKECSRPTFARNKSVWYRKPIGQGVEGFGIRFAEMAVRCMKNLMVESMLIFEDDMKEVHRVVVTDLESNVTYPQEFKVTKTVERSKPKDDGTFVSVRTNSQGRQTFTVLADDDDLLNKRGSLLSKAMRTIAMRIIPGDIQDECEAKIKQIRADRAATDPDGMRKDLMDEFASVGVTPTMLVEYLGHDLAQCSPSQLTELRDIYSAIAEGEATWAQALEGKGVLSAKDVQRKEAMDAVAAAKSADDLKALGKTFTPKFRENGDRAGYDLFAAAVQKRGAELRAAQPQTAGPEGQATQAAPAATQPLPATGADDPWLKDLDSATAGLNGAVAQGGPDA